MTQIGMLLQVILGGLPGLLIRPWDFPIFWILVVLVGLQYRRVAESERRLYGVVKNSVWRQVAGSVAAGAVAGLLTSLLMAALGASLTGAGITWLLPLALLLMAINPRFMCFSYAGGIVAVSHLLFGWPDVYVPAIMALVAVLHIAESVLIALRGASCTTPVTVRHRERATTRTGFMMQGFWPLPLLLLFVVSLPPGSGQEGLLAMPEWWPLIVPPPDVAAQSNAVFTLFPVAAVLGYSDLAVRSLPRTKARASAALLFGYSVVLLGLAVLASHVPALVILPALWGPGGHELVVRYGAKREFVDEAAVKASAEGLAVLDVFPQGGAAKAGIRTGDVILSVDGRGFGPADVMAEWGTATPVGAAMPNPPPANEDGAGARPPVEVRLLRDGQEIVKSVQLIQLAPGEAPMLGVVPVPQPDAPPQMEIHNQGFLSRWFARLARRQG